MMLAEAPTGSSEAQRATIVRWETRMRALGDELRAKYSQGVFPASVLLPDVEKWLRFSEAGAELDVRAMTSALRRDFSSAALSLRGIRDWLKSNPSTSYKHSNSLVQTFVSNALKALDAFIAVGRPTLTTSADNTELVEKVRNAPSALTKWTLEQALAALGLPKWALPALGVTALVGVGLWAYVSFLAPVGAIARVRRANPRRRHRRRRRRR